MAKWFYLTGGQPTGPIEPAALKQLATTGRLKPTDKVRREDMAEWYEAKQVKGLFPSAVDQPGGSHVDGNAAPPREAGKVPLRSPVQRVVNKSFRAWYGARLGRIWLPLQIVLWLFYGFIWIPAWWFAWLLVGAPRSTERSGTDVVIRTYSVIYRGGIPSQPKPMEPAVHNLLLRSGISSLLLGMNRTVTLRIFSNRFELVPKGDFNGAVIPWNRVFALDIVAEHKVLLLTKRDNFHIAYWSEDGSDAVLKLQMVSGLTGSGEKKCQELVDCLRDHGINEMFQAKPPDKPAQPCPHCGTLIAASDLAHMITGQCPYCGRELAAPPVRADGHHCPKCGGNDIKSFEYVHALGKNKTTGSLTVGAGSTGAVGSITGMGLGGAYASGRLGTVTGLAEMCAPPEKAKWAALSPEKQEYNERIYPKKVAVWKRSWICMTCGTHWVGGV
jgi:hypothetical protein